MFLSAILLLLLLIVFEPERWDIWLGKPYWGHGYCTEVAQELVRFGLLGVLNLDMVEARHYSRNVVSGNVMTKIGLKHIHHLPKHINKWGVLEDVEGYAISQKEFVEGVLLLGEAGFGGSALTRYE
mmetsp:Transcript_21420/g.35453  ORF Transcript_21420/g.35453 Transcript_21420/m.35453 type:complete len:126 (-) Transcript_21420:400-777(-)